MALESLSQCTENHHLKSRKAETEKFVFKQSTKTIKITTHTEKSVALSRAFIVLPFKSKRKHFTLQWSRIGSTMEASTPEEV